MLDYNGAEKGCGSIKKGAMMMVTVFTDGDGAYLAGEKEFSIIRHSYVENDRRACWKYRFPNPESPQQIRS